MPISARPADPVGLQYWVSQNSAPINQSIASIAANFALSPEYTANFTGLSNAQAVNNLYLNLFGRGAEPAGLLYWAGELTAGRLTISNVALAIANGAQTADLAALNAKITAATSFTTALSDTSQEILGYNGTAAYTIGRAYLAGVTDATTGAAATAPAALQATTDSIANIGTPGQTFNLTANVDAFVGTANNDTFVSTGGTETLTPLDSLNGGAGNDTFQYVQSTAIVLPASASVTNIENATLTSGGLISGSVAGWTGLTRVTTIANGNTTLTAAATTAVTSASTGNTAITGGSNVTVTASALAATATTAVSGAAGNVVVSATGALAGAQSLGAITVSAAGTVSVVQSTANSTVNTTATQGTVSVTGGANTTSVSVVNAKAVTAAAAVAGIATNTVTITDVNNGSATKAGVLTTATVSGYTTLGINANSLTTLSLTNGSGNIIINNSGLTTATNKTLAVTVDGLTAGGTLDDADIYTTLNVTTANNSSVLDNITFGAATALTVAGTNGLTLTSAAGLGALKTVTVSGAAGLSANLGGNAALTAVDTSATTGSTTVTINAANATFTGGAGADSVTTSSTTVTKAISLGDGNDRLTLASGTTTTNLATITGGAGTDTLGLVAADAVTLSATSAFAGKVSGFETLSVTGATGPQAVDLVKLGNYTNVTTDGVAAAGNLTLNGFGANGTLTITADSAGTHTINNTNFIAGTADTINLVLTKAGLLAAGTVVANNVEVINITTADTQTTATNPLDTLTLSAGSATTVTVAGNAGLNLGAAGNLALTSVDASGITKGSFTFTSDALTGAAAIKGSATGVNTIDFTLAGDDVTYTGGTGVDALTFTATNANDNTITLGAGANTVLGLAFADGKNTVTAGSGADIVRLGSGNNTVSLGDGANTFQAGNGANTYTGGAGVDTVTVGRGANTLTLGGGADVVTFTAVALNGNSYSVVTDAAVGDRIVFTDAGQLSGTSTFTTARITLAGTAVFQDFLDAATASATAGANSNFAWFQFNGNTYIVEDNDNSVTFQNGVDNVVQLTGLVTVNGFAAVATTSAAFTLA